MEGRLARFFHDFSKLDQPLPSYHDLALLFLLVETSYFTFPSSLPFAISVQFKAVNRRVVTVCIVSFRFTEKGKKKTNTGNLKYRNTS